MVTSEFQLNKISPTLTTPKKQEITAERIFMCVNIFVMSILIFCIKGFLEFREYCQAHGYYVFATESLVWVIIGFFTIYVILLLFAEAIKYSYFHFMRPYVYSIINDEYEGETRKLKTKYVLKLSYDTFFYSCMSIVAYTLFRNEYWFPSMVGGSGQCTNLYKDYPNWPTEKRTYLEIYFLFELGVHAFSVFEMTVLKSRKDKYHEFLLHHFIAVSLILFSLMSNQIVPGAMILIVHNISDVPMAGCKAVIETRYKCYFPEVIGYVILVFTWIYCRVFVFPYCLLTNVWVNTPLEKDEWYMISFEYKYLLSMACILVLMHVYWTYYLLVVGMAKLTQKKFINPHEKNSTE